MTETGDIPRWASDLGPETWERVNELLYEGWQPAAVRHALDIPEIKKRSLEKYAERYRHRRIMAPVTRLAELLAGGALEMGPDFLKLLNMVVSQGLSGGDDARRSQRAAAILAKFMATLLKMGAEHETAEIERQRQEAGEGARGRVDPAEIMRKVLAEYGVKFEGGKAVNA